MRRIVGGEFRMGSERFYPEEGPERVVGVGDFWIDSTPVTNREFARFVRATGYRTLAEAPLNPRDYPGVESGLLRAGSLVFTPTTEPVELDDPGLWWNFVVGAEWRHPFGPGSDLDGLDEHPVVHVGHADASAFARWAGKRLPTEAEWEYAARGGLHGADYAWGDELAPGGRAMARIWEGDFPWRNTAAADRTRTSAVANYPANGYGLYDMIGNVWEWTADRYTARTTAKSGCCTSSREEPAPGQAESYVVKGGSHLCAPEYCRRYRPAARQPQTNDTTTSHIGFRCVVDT
ncbi:MAG: formylglycine-generating enzyme family protein [Proteobacteria bacterium]|nr:formylglycine-generating enzyme family protein [Pseudomonadota bacterium]